MKISPFTPIDSFLPSNPFDMSNDALLCLSLLPPPPAWNMLIALNLQSFTENIFFFLSARAAINHHLGADSEISR